MKTYEIKEANNGKKNIHYFINDVLETIELYSQEGFTAEIKSGYIAKDAPNWLGLEQTLRYSNEFGKAFQYATEKGFNLFTTTLVNGKLGHASENALAFAFSVLGIEWTSEEIANINAALEANNFLYRLE
jgi:hypothetical protein